MENRPTARTVTEAGERQGTMCKGLVCKPFVSGPPDRVLLSSAALCLREINRHKIREFGRSRRQRPEDGEAEAEALADDGGEPEHFDGRGLA